ncbi:MAG: DUF438 domain-containing protein [Bacillota bacterium]
MDKKQKLKEIIRRLHEGEDPASLKQEFKQLAEGVDALDIGKAEQELVAEGVPQSELRRLCHLHLAVLEDALSGPKQELPEWHPIRILMGEHEAILAIAGQLDPENPSSLREGIGHLGEAEKHYLREENVLFAAMDKHGITEPPAIMWSEHDEIRSLEKEIAAAVESGGGGQLARKVEQLRKKLASHVYKENNVLYPMALSVLDQHEWEQIRHEFDEIGYCCFTPAVGGEHKPVHRHGVEPSAAVTQQGTIEFPTGSLTVEETQWLLNTLPVEITFVDRNDVFKYFSGTQDRAFARARSSLGRKVQQCHPAKSLPLVNRVLEELKSGKKDSEHFWIKSGEKYLYISYFAVRNQDGEYLGVLETVQDIAPLQQIRGEKRLVE